MPLQLIVSYLAAVSTTIAFARLDADDSQQFERASEQRLT
jgi:hypothetical protein